MDFQPLTQDRIDKALRQQTSTPPRHKKGEEFLKGPIPLPWLSAASRLPGKALAVALALWFRAGLTKSRTVKVGSQLLSRFNVGRKSVSRCLRAMEEVGLVDVERHPGRCPVVTIRDMPN